MSTLSPLHATSTKKIEQSQNNKNEFFEFFEITKYLLRQNIFSLGKVQEHSLLFYFETKPESYHKCK